MALLHLSRTTLGILASLLILQPCLASPAKTAQRLVLQSLDFTVGTNLSAITVHGRASTGADEAGAFRGEAVFGQEGLDSVTAAVPVDLLSTGMSLRDRHMKELIFKDSGGTFPPLKLASQRIKCRDGNCRVHALLSIRGIERPTDFDCLLEKADGAGTATVSTCSTVLKLSAYQIERPSQLGVRVQDEVSLRVRVGLR